MCLNFYDSSYFGLLQHSHPLCSVNFALPTGGDSHDELPGLWNGAMAKWTTIFVEVPLVTFNPVKTVNDLLKPAHQPQ